MVLVATWGGIEECSCRERCASPTVGGNGETGPFDYFAAEVGTRHVLKKPSTRNMIACVTRLAEVAQDVVGSAWMPTLC